MTFAEGAQRQAESLLAASRSLELNMARLVVSYRDRGRISPEFADRVMDALADGREVTGETEAEQLVAVCAGLTVGYRERARALTREES